MSLALASNALATDEELSARLGVGRSDTLVRIVNAASQRIETYLDRKLARVVGGVEAVAGFGTAYLRLQRTPIVSVASIALDGVTIDTAAYSIHDADAGLLYAESGWVDTAALMAGASYEALPGTEERLYSVTYTGGYTLPKDGAGYTLPADIEQACLELATLMFRGVGRDPSISSEKLLSYSVTYSGAAGQEAVDAILQGLDSYRRLSVP